jgi:hypothetical protein
MTENTNNATDTTPAELTPAPNGHRHGPGNEAATGDQQQGAAVNKGIDKGAAPLSKKQQKAQQRAAAKAAASRLAAVHASTESAAAGAEAPASVEAPLPPPVEVSSEVVSAPPPAEAPIEVPISASEGLRLRMKVWSHPKTATRYLMPSAFMRDVVNGQPVTDVMVAYAMRDDDTILVTLTASQWNALPFFYFQETVPAPRGASRPVDVIVSRGRR